MNFPFDIIKELEEGRDIDGWAKRQKQVKSPKPQPTEEAPFGSWGLPIALTLGVACAVGMPFIVSKKRD